MRITCPSCTTGYDVAADAIGPNGRKVRCRACGAHWVESPPAPFSPPLPAPPPPGAALDQETGTSATPDGRDVFRHEPPFGARRRLRAPLIALALGLLVLLLGGAVAVAVWGPREVASGLGLADRRVDLGIAITREPDWRMIAGGSQIFAVAGRIWNPSTTAQPVPDIRAELLDRRGKRVFAWTITRPVATLPPGKSVQFDGAAVDVPPTSARVAVSFVGTGR